MNTYETAAVKDTERFALKLLQEFGIQCNASNTVTTTDVDITTETGKKIDVQYSNNFAKYGDFRVDIVSAFVYGENTNIQYNTILDKFEKRYKCKITKAGKVYQPNYVDYLIVFFYYNRYIKDTTENILIIKISELLQYIDDNSAELFDCIKINDKGKYDLPDKHGSAFIPINVCCLQEKCECFFGTWQELCNQKNDIKTYIG